MHQNLAEGISFPGTGWRLILIQLPPRAWGRLVLDTLVLYLMMRMNLMWK